MTISTSVDLKGQRQREGNTISAVGEYAPNQEDRNLCACKSWILTRNYEVALGRPLSEREIRFLGANYALITPVVSNAVLVRFPRPPTELFRRWPRDASIVRPRPPASMSMDPCLSCLFRSSCKFSRATIAGVISVAFVLPLLRLVFVASSARGAKWMFVSPISRDVLIVAFARDFRRRLSASSSIARTSFSTSESLYSPEYATRSRAESFGLEVARDGWESALNFFAAGLDGPATSGADCDANRGGWMSAVCAGTGWECDGWDSGARTINKPPAPSSWGTNRVQARQ